MYYTTNWLYCCKNIGLLGGLPFVLSKKTQHSTCHKNIQTTLLLNHYTKFPYYIVIIRMTQQFFTRTYKLTLDCNDETKIYCIKSDF